MRNTNLVFDRQLIERCQTNAPRYTSYPTADRFDYQYEHQQHYVNLSTNNITEKMISLYVHIPFCNTLCLFCACNKIITNDRNNITQYIKYLAKEFELYYNLMQKKLTVIQLHFGGGSPSWLSITELNQIMTIIKQYFNLDSAREISMELDPRHVTTEFLKNLRTQGFNRISVGVQDIDPVVQKAVNRIQSSESTVEMINQAKILGFNSTNIDLIYGLPYQTLTSFTHTIKWVIELNPARIALFNYAHLPSLFTPQTRIKDVDLPDASVKLDILQMAVNELQLANYLFIGMDHFAQKNDELALALQNNTLQRNFQGYSTFAGTQLLSFGVSAIGYINSCYYQNQKDLPSYYHSLDNNYLPILRGRILDFDDKIRADIIQSLMCNFKLYFNHIEKQYSINFTLYFAVELVELVKLNDLGLIELNPMELTVTDSGRFLIRNVALVFDKYLRMNKNLNYSKVI